ncbi:MAG: circularly permuted type 2 ATP-grasp protein [Geminicoccaceae bacterium]
MDPAPAIARPRTTAADEDQLAALLSGYGQDAGRYDEMLAPDGSLRPHWRSFVEGFAALGPEGREAAADSTKRSLRESGIAFNVYADPEDRAHAWRLDLLPVLVTLAEWRTVEAGLKQRARLVSAVLQDVYGEARLLRQGLLPPALVFSGNEFLRPLARRDGHTAPLLTLYACDIARTANGSWVVLADQSDTGVGNGYVLAGRVALSHGLADLFHLSHARRLAGYYVQVQEALAQQASRADGRSVMMSPGPDNPSYFSHAYLARYLGYTLCEADDLTVRDNQVYLKTLDGLQRVDLILRKLAGRGTDPLHLPGGGTLGVAGLVQAIRAGRVAIANGLGSGLAQHRALAPFSRELCRHVLGEDLALPDAEAWWMGDARQRDAAVARLREVEIGPVMARNDPGEVTPRLVGASLTGPARARFLERLEREGPRLVAQMPVQLATTPAYESGLLRPVPWAVRTYVARVGDDWAVLPGGLVRMAGAGSAAALPNGFGSKDLWVTDETPEASITSILRTTMQEVRLRRAGRDLLSRTADNLFWLGRYAERAEGSMRLLRSILVRLLEDRMPEATPVLLRRLLDIELHRDERELDSSRLDELVRIHMLEPDRAYGLRESLDHVHRTATLVRDQINHDAWRMLNALHIDRRWRQPRRPLVAGPAIELLDEGIRVLNAFSGTEAENMTRNFAWRFLGMGRRLERAAHLVDLVHGLVLDSADPEADGSLRLLLELGDSFMTYRSRYVMTPLVAPVLDLLLLDETNPRSLAFQLMELEGHLRHLPGEGPHRSQEQRVVLRLLTDIRLADLDDLSKRDEEGNLPSLQALLDHLRAGLPEVSNLIATSHFAHAETPVVTLAALRRETP